MRKLRKWEEEYMQYKNGEKHKEMQEIQTKLNNKLATKEEYDKLMKMRKIEANIDKVSNIIELKQKLEEEIKQIKEEEAKSESKNKNLEEQNQKDEAIYKEAQEINLELSSIETDKEKVKEELKNKNISDEERENLNKKLVELDNKLQENNIKYTKNLEAIKNIENRKPEKEPIMKSNKFSGISNEELDKRKFELSTKISKCNMVAGNLMKGMSWDAIDLKLEKWQDKKYVPKDGKSLTEKVAVTLGKKDFEKAKVNVEKENKEEKSIAKPDRIAQWMEKNKNKHKWTYAILNKFYNKENHPKIYNALNKLSRSGQEEQEEQEPQEQLITKPEPAQTTFKERKDDFDKYLKDVAERGLKTINQEKLAKAREQAQNREAQKFNKTTETKVTREANEYNNEMEQE